MCRPDELEVWKEMLLDFPHTPQIHDEYMQIMTDYYNAVYAKKSDLFFQKCLLACNEDDTPIGRGFVWKAYDRVNTIHWYKVLKEYEKLKIVKAPQYFLDAAASSTVEEF